MAITASIERLKNRLERQKRLSLARAFRLGQQESEQAVKTVESFFAQNRINEQKIELIAKIAKSIVDQELAKDPKSIVLMCEKLLENLKTRPIKLFIHPQGTGAIKHGESINQDLWHGVEIIGDETLTFGSIVIKTPQCVVDAKVETQIDTAISLLEAKKWLS